MLARFVWICADLWFNPITAAGRPAAENNSNFAIRAIYVVASVNIRAIYVMASANIRAIYVVINLDVRPINVVAPLIFTARNAIISGVRWEKAIDMQ